MKAGSIDVMLMDQLEEKHIDAETRQKINSLITECDFKVATAMLSKAKEGVGGFQLALLDETFMKKVSNEIVVPGMDPWR